MCIWFKGIGFEDKYMKWCFRESTEESLYKYITTFSPENIDIDKEFLCLIKLEKKNPQNNPDLPSSF